jgi:mono/diheme cytochrome c family protein
MPAFIIDVELKLKKMKTLKHIISLLLVMLLIGSVSAQDWDVPQKKADIKNPAGYDAGIIKKGKGIYDLNCKSCHGEVGKNNGLPLVPKPVDPLDPKMQDNTDGELFYKISEGRVTMPSFKAVIPENDRWAVVSYIRSVNPEFVAPTAKTETKTPNKTEAPVNLKDVEIVLQADRGESVVSATVYGKTEDGKSAPLKDAEVGFFVKRYFGDLRVGERDLTTNEFGVAKIDFPADLPGDTEGKVEMLVKLMDSEKYGNIETKQQIDIAKISVPVDMTEERALWNTRAKTPIWLLVVYLGLVIGVWSGIFYIVSLIMKMKKVA